MNPQQNTLTYIKLAIVGLMLAGIFVLAALGKIDAQVAITSAVGAVGALVVALGISSAGGAAATAIQAQTRAMVARGEAEDAPDQVKRVPLAKADQRGFVTGKTLAAILGAFVAGVVVYFGAVDLMGCSTLSNPVISTPAANFAACVIVRGATDAIEGMPANKITADVIDTCGCPDTSDPAECTAAVNQILDAEAKARAMRASYADGGR